MFKCSGEANVYSYGFWDIAARSLLVLSPSQRGTGSEKVKNNIKHLNTLLCLGTSIPEF